MLPALFWSALTVARAIGGDFFGSAADQKMTTSSRVCTSCLTGKTSLLFPGIHGIKIASSTGAAGAQLLLSRVEHKLLL